MAINLDTISNKQYLGRGSFGKTYRGTHKDYGTVVVKVGNISPYEYHNQKIAFECGAAFEPLEYSDDWDSSKLIMRTDEDYTPVASRPLNNFQLGYAILMLIRMHFNGISHCDIHTSNLMVAKGKMPKFIDFGRSDRATSADWLRYDLRDLLTGSFCRTKLYRELGYISVKLWNNEPTVTQAVAKLSESLPREEWAQLSAEFSDTLDLLAADPTL